MDLVCRGDAKTDQDDKNNNNDNIDDDDDNSGLARGEHRRREPVRLGCPFEIALGVALRGEASAVFH